MIIIPRNSPIPAAFRNYKIRQQYLRPPSFLKMYKISVVAVVVLALLAQCNGLGLGTKFAVKAVPKQKLSGLSAGALLAEKTPSPKASDKSGYERFQQLLEDSKKDDPNDKKPPIYEPGSYLTHVLASLAYVVPIADASDVGKYMFEAYPSIGAAYSTVFGPFAALYNGVPFLPFLIFFAMSYICRAPTFPTEIRFHFSQAFMLSLIQFIPSLLFGFMEKGGVPGMGVLYNSCKNISSVKFY